MLRNDYLDYAEWVGCRVYELVQEGIDIREAHRRAGKEFHEQPDIEANDERLPENQE